MVDLQEEHFFCERDRWKIVSDYSLKLSLYGSYMENLPRTTTEVLNHVQLVDFDDVLKRNLSMTIKKNLADITDREDEVGIVVVDSK